MQGFWHDKRGTGRSRTQGPLRYVAHAEMIEDVAADSGS
jgi:hypothetical protein